MAGLQENINYFKNQFKFLVKTLEHEVPAEYKDKVQEKLYNELPDKAAFEDLDVVQASISAPVGHGKNA